MELSGFSPPATINGVWVARVNAVPLPSLPGEGGEGVAASLAGMARARLAIPPPIGAGGLERRLPATLALVSCGIENISAIKSQTRRQGDGDNAQLLPTSGDMNRLGFRQCTMNHLYSRFR